MDNNPLPESLDEEAIRWRNAVADGNLDLADQIAKDLKAKGHTVIATPQGVHIITNSMRTPPTPIDHSQQLERDLEIICEPFPHILDKLTKAFEGYHIIPKGNPTAENDRIVVLRNPPNSYLNGCLVVGREGDSPFTSADGVIIAHLERYAIIPYEQYEPDPLLAAVRMIIESHFDEVLTLPPTLEDTPPLPALLSGDWTAITYRNLQIEWGPVVVTAETQGRVCAQMAEHVIGKARFIGHFPRLVWRNVPAFIEHFDPETHIRRLSLTMRAFYKPNSEEVPDGHNNQAD